MSYLTYCPVVVKVIRSNGDLGLRVWGTDDSGWESPRLAGASGTWGTWEGPSFAVVETCRAAGKAGTAAGRTCLVVV